MFFNFSFDIFEYFLKRESTQFFVSVAIRSLALGMVGIFESVYLYLYFGRSFAHVLFFWAAYSGIFALTVVFGGRIMAKIGLKRTILLSNVFLFGFYICLFFVYQFFWLVSLALILRALGSAVFWPAFHTDFVRFTEGSSRAEHVGRLSIIALIAAIVSPVVGGLILAGLGYMTLFMVVLLTLFASTFPLFLSKERYEVYSDTYKNAWRRIVKNKDISFSLASLGIEGGIDRWLWPVFIFAIGVSYRQMGGISTFTLLISALFAWYMGKVTSKRDKGRLLNLGAGFLAIAWAIKYFVVDALSVFLAQNFYRIAKTSTLIPFKTIQYDECASRKQQADEFIIYREIIMNIVRFFLLMLLAIFFYFLPNTKINIVFIIAAFSAIGLTWLAKPRLFSFKKLKLKK